MQQLCGYRKSALLLIVLGSMLIFSCSEQPQSGPLSPRYSSESQALIPAEANDEALGEVRPVPRKDATRSEFKDDPANTLSKNGGAFGNNTSSDCRGTVAKQLISRFGGALWHCGHAIIVPPFAISSTKEFSIAVDNNEHITVDFGPDMWFNYPITIAVSYRDADLTGIDVNTLTMAWFDESNSKWIPVHCLVDKNLQVVWAQVPHFTQYTLSAR